MRSTLLFALALLALIAVPAGAAKLVTGAAVKNGSLTGKDIKNGTLGPADLKSSAQGAQGPQGEAGPAGPAGSFSSIEIRMLLNYNGSGGVVNCEPGEFATGGGAIDVAPSSVVIRESAPLPAGADVGPGSPTRWYVNFSGTPTSADLYVVCVR